MALTVYWSKRADRKFDQIIEYLEREWGETVTRAFVRKVYDFLDILVEIPESGSIEHAGRNIRGFVIVKQLMVFYKVDGGRIVLLNFFDSRQSSNAKKY